MHIIELFHKKCAFILEDSDSSGNTKKRVKGCLSFAK